GLGIINLSSPVVYASLSNDPPRRRPPAAAPAPGPPAPLPRGPGSLPALPAGGDRPPPGRARLSARRQLDPSSIRSQSGPRPGALVHPRPSGDRLDGAAVDRPALHPLPAARQRDRLDQGRRHRPPPRRHRSHPAAG